VYFHFFKEEKNQVLPPQKTPTIFLEKNKKRQF